MLLAHFFQRNNELYRVPNNRIFSNLALTIKIGRYVGIALKNKRLSGFDAMRRNLAMAFSWAAAFANRMDIKPDSIWECYPNKCPYCSGKPCCCGSPRAPHRTVFVHDPSSWRPGTISELQNMFREIYPHNEAGASADHLFKEIFELQEAVESFSHTAGREGNRFANMVEETVDVFAHLFAVVNCAGFDLEASVTTLFADGCPGGCGTVPCSCGYTVATAIGTQPSGV